MSATLHHPWQAVPAGRPGFRFQEHYERVTQQPRTGTFGRVGRIALAGMAFAIGAVLILLPAPSVIFFAIGAGLLASESRLIARGLDWLELRLRAAWTVRADSWRRLPAGARVAIGTSAVGAIIAGDYALYCCWFS
jgi:hypothetical protein